MPPRTLPLTLLRPFLDPRSKERFVDLRKARDPDDLGKQKQALLGFPNESIVPPRNDALPSDTMDTLAHVNKMMSAKTVPPQLNQFGRTFTKAAASKERGLPVQFKIRITDLDEQSRTFLFHFHCRLAGACAVWSWV